MAKQFHVFISHTDLGCSGHLITGTFKTSEEAQAFLLEHKDIVGDDPDECYIIFGERFGFTAETTPVEYRLTGPEEGE